MPEYKKQYYVQVAGQSQGRFIDADAFEKSKDKFYKEFGDKAIAYEVDNYLPGSTDINSNDQFEITIQGMNQPRMVDGDTFSKNQEQFYKQFPNAQVKRMRPYDYYTPHAEQIASQITELDEQEVPFLQQYEEAMQLANDTSHLPAEEKQKYIDFVTANSQRYNELTNERNALVEQHKNNPVVARQRKEVADENIKALDELLNGSDEMRGIIPEMNALQMGNRSYEDLSTGEKMALAMGSNPMLVGSGGRYMPTDQMRRVQDNVEKDYQNYEAAAQLVEDAKKMYGALKDSDLEGQSFWQRHWSRFNGFAEGAADDVANKEFWRSTLAMQNNLALRDLHEKVLDVFGSYDKLNDASEDEVVDLIDEKLSPSEQALLVGYLANAQAAQDNADINWAYKAGQGAVESAKFAAEFMLFSEATAPVLEGVTNGMLKWFGSKAVNAASKFARAAIKTAGKIAIADTRAAIGGLMQTAFAPTTLTNVTEQLAQIDDNGQLVEAVTAIRDGLADQLIENATEFGLGPTNKLLEAGTKQLGKAFGNASFGKIFTPQVARALRRGGINSYIEEYGEEVNGAIIRQLTGLDKNAWKDFTTAENQLQIITSFAPMMAMGYVSSTAQKNLAFVRYDLAGNKLRNSLKEAGYDPVLADSIIETVNGDTPNDLVSNSTPYIKNIMAENAGNEKLIKDFVNYLSATAIYREVGEQYSFQQEELRQGEKRRIDAIMTPDAVDGQGNPTEGVTSPWIQEREVTLPSGETMTLNSVRTLTDAQGNEYFVLSESEGKLSLEDRNHDRRIVDADNLDGWTDSGAMSVDDYLDLVLTRQERVADQQRMAEEEAVNNEVLLRSAQPGAQINTGTVENPETATILQNMGNTYIVQKADGTTQEYTKEEIANFMDLPLRAESQEEKDKKESDELIRLSQLRDLVNEPIQNYDVSELVGQAGAKLVSVTMPVLSEETGRYVFPSFVRTPDGEVERVEFNEEQLTGLLKNRLNQSENEIRQETEATTETTEPAEEQDTTPRDFRGNPLPMRTNKQTGDLVVDANTLWNKDPEAWARWNDTNPNSRVGSKERLEYTIGELGKEIEKDTKAIQKAALKGIDEDKMDEMEAALSSKTTRANLLQSILNSYNRPAEAGQTIAGEQRQAQAEKTKREQQAGFPGIQQKWDDAEKIVGVADEIRLPNGESIAGHYVMTEAEAPTASHNPAQGFAMTEGFPVDENGKTVNDRDYEHDKAAQQSVLEKAANYDQRALQTPVIVSSDGVVLSGNDRTMASQIAAANNTDGAYLDYLGKYSQKYGFTAQQVAQFQHPRVVFVPDASMPYNAATFAKFNAEEKKSQNKTEKAVKAGKTLTPDALGALATLVDQYEDINALYNDATGVDQLLTILLGAEVISQEQVAALKDGNTLSGTGMDLLESTLIGAALDEEGVRIAMSDKSIRKSVVSAISQIIVGNTLADFSLRTELTDAIALIANGKRAKEIKFGETVQNYVRQQHLFEDDVLAEATVQMLADAINDRRTSYLKKVLSLYNRDAVESANGQMSLLTNDVPSRDAILRNVLEYLGYDTAIIYDTSERGAEQGAEQPAEPEPEEGQDASSLQGDEGSPAGQVSQYDRERAEVLLEQGNVGELAPYLTDEETAEFLRLYDAFEPYNEALGEAYTRLDADLKSKDKKVKKAAQEEIARYEAEQEEAFEPVNAYTQALIEKYGLEEETGYQEPEETDEEEGFEDYDIEEELAEQEEPKQKKGKKTAKKGEKKAKKEEAKPYVVKGGASEATIAKQTYTQEEWEEFVYGYSSFTVFESKKTGERIQTYMVDDSHPIYKDHRVLVSRRLPDSDGQMSKDGHYTGPHTETYTTTDYILKYLKANKFKPVFDKSGKSYRNKPYKNKYGFWVNQHGVVMNPIRIELPSVKKGWANGSDTYYYQNDDGKWFAGGSASFGTGGGSLGVKRGPYDNKSAAIKATIDALERFRKAHAGNNSDLRDVDNLIRNLKTKTLPQALMEEGAVDNFTGVEFTASVYDEGFQGSLFAEEEQAPATEVKPKRKTTAKKTATNKAKPAQKDKVAPEDEEEAEPKFTLEDEEGTLGNYHWIDERVCTNPTFITLPGDDRLDAVPKVVLAEKDGNWYYNTFITDDSGKGSAWGSQIPTFKDNYIPYQSREDAIKHAISYIRFVLDNPAKKQQNKFGETYNKAKELIDYLTKMELPQDEFGAGEQEAETPAPAETKPQAPAYGSQNKIVTTDQYEELKRRMREKLGQLNAGFDPEVLSIGAQMATYHIEAGARQFIDFSKRMIKDLGDAIRPYLKAIYNGARDFPGMEELEPDMTPYDEVRATDVNAISIEGPDNEEQETAETIQGLEYLSRLDLYALLEDHIDKVMGGALTQGFNGFSLVDMVPIGSRAFGTAREDSDLDILVEYEGSAKEDSVFNVLNEEPLEIGGIKVDFFPIRSQESGTLTQWLQSHNNGRPVEKAPVQEVNTENFLGAVNDLANGKRNEVKLSDFAEKVGKSADNSVNLPPSLGGKADRHDYRAYITPEAKKLFEEKARNAGKKYAFPELSYLPYASIGGAIIPVEELETLPEVMEAEQRLKDIVRQAKEETGSEALQLTPEQLDEYANRLLGDQNGSFDENRTYTGPVAREKKAFIVIGRSAAGKSSVFADPLSRDNKARIIDSDIVKPWLENYNNGYGTNYVHPASALVANEALERAARLGENIVIPRIGGASVIAEIAIPLRAAGYEVNFYFNEVKAESSIMRAAARFAQTGRYLSLQYLKSIGDKPLNTYLNFANKTIGEALNELSETQIRELRGRIERLSGLEGGSTGEGRETGNGAGQGTLDGDLQGTLGAEELGRDLGLDLSSKLFHASQWKNNDVDFGEPPVTVWSSDSGEPFPGTQNEQESAPATPTTLGELGKYTHTKTGKEMTIVRLSGDRLTKEEFKDLKARAKELGGYYSSFGSAKGFLFDNEADAIKFNNLETINNAEEETDEQTGADTSAIVSEAGALISQTETIINDEGQRPVSQRAAEAVRAIDESLDKINDQLALLGYYKADTTDESGWDEVYEYRRSAEKKAVKDADRLAKKLASDLGLEVGRKQLAKANIAPAGGDISFRLPLKEGHNLYVDIEVQPAEYDGNAGMGYSSDLVVRGVGTYSGRALDILYRLEIPAGEGKFKVGANNFLPANVTYADMLDELRKAVKDYLPEQAPAQAVSAETDILQVVKEQAEKSRKTAKKSVTSQEDGDSMMGDLFSDLAGEEETAPAPEESTAPAQSVKPTEMNGFAIGEKVLYTPSQGDRKTQQATIYDFEYDGRPVLDAGLAPILYEVVEWDTIKKLDEPVNTTDNGSERTDDERAQGTQADSIQSGGGAQETEGGNGEGERQESGRTDTGRAGRSQSSERNSRHRFDDSVKRNTRNNRVAKGEVVYPKTTAARYRANIEAIRLLKELQDSGKQANKAQMAVLRQYTGWGGLGTYFNNTYTPEHRELKALLTPEEMDAAALSINTAYYTPVEVIDSMWDVAKRLGFEGGNILEGSAGIGNILASMPKNISEHSEITAVELDNITGGILEQLYPDATVHIKGFQETDIPNNSVDLAITNVPFGDIQMYDSKEKDLTRKFGGKIHDFCIAKNIRKLAEGGIGIFISTRGTLDNNSKSLRQWIVNEGDADVIGAFRLNNETFEGTGATSDIIVVRKRVNGKKSPNAIDIADTVIARKEDYELDEREWNPKTRAWEFVRGKAAMEINSYFVEHPENMGGEMGFGFEHKDTYRPGSSALWPSEKIDQNKRLAKWAKQFSDMLAEEQAEAKQAETTEAEDSNATKEGQLVTNSKGEICVSRRGKAIPLGLNAQKVKGYSKAQVLADYDALKTAINETLDYQLKNEPDEGLKPVLDKLNRAYDTFKRKYDRLNKNTAITFLRNDVDFPSVAAVEGYKETKDINGKTTITVKKTDIFSKRVLGAKRVPTPKDTKDGVIISINQYGRIDIPFIADALNKSDEEVRQEIITSGLGFENPQTGNLEVDYEYLSGNVREKLDYAREHNEGGRYDKNIEALEKAVPTDIPAHLIEFSLGSDWMPVELYTKYAKEKLGANDNFVPANLGGSWVLPEYRWDMGLNNEKNRSAGVTSEKLNMVKTGDELMIAAMNNSSVVFSRTYKDNLTGESHTEHDKEATQAAATKISEMREDFKEWARGKMLEDPELAERVGKIYNNTFNAIVPKEISETFIPEHFEGQVLTMGKEGKPFHLYQHQSKAVIRATTEPLMMAHEVGSGKTFTLISSAMEMRRLGTAKKPMIVVQNATLGQFVSSAKELYPNAKVLTISEADRTVEGRSAFYAKIKYNDWDMIIVPQSVFEMIPDSEERQRAYIQEKIEEKEFILEQAKQAKNSTEERRLKQELEDLQYEYQFGEKPPKKGKGGKRDAKKEAEAKANAVAKAKKQLDRRTDEVADFDDMGIDALLIDEAHNYKHLGFSTAMQRGVKGVDSTGSKRSAGVYLKTRAVFDKVGWKNVVFATGTPISNTAAEIWTFMKYLMPAETMRKNHIYYFDDFVRNFGNIAQSLEFTTSGKFKENTRFASYTNLPELMRIWMSVADIVLTKEAVAAGGEKLDDKLPKMEGGQARDIYLPQSASLVDIMNAVRAKLEWYENLSGKEKKENSYIPLTMFGIAKMAAIDPRLVDKNAKDEPQSKTNKAVEETLKALEDSKKFNGTAALFCDNFRRWDYTESGKRVEGFNIFEEIGRKLIEAGVPADQIVIMKSGMTTAAKEKIFAKVNAGEIRVIMGSTETLGTGVNIQERLFFEAHIDAPNRPMDYTQRMGRILRQGNLLKDWGIEARVVRFGVEDSLDVTAYQRLSTKSKFIDSVMNGKALVANSMENRVLEEEEEGVFDNPVAVLSGSQYALLKSQAERELRKLRNKKEQHKQDQIYIEKALKDNNNRIEFNQKLIEEGKKNLEKTKDAFPDGKVKEISIEGKKVKPDQIAATLKEKITGPLRDYLEKNRENSYFHDETKEYNISFDGVLVKISVAVSRTSGYDERLRRFSNQMHALVEYSAPKLGINGRTVPGGVSGISGIIPDFQEKIASGSYYENGIRTMENTISRLTSDNDLMLQRRGKPFADEEKLKQQEEIVKDYTEKMKAEMAEKEAKYAEVAKNATTTFNLDNVEVEDEPQGEDSTSYRDVDESAPKLDVNDPFVLAEAVSAVNKLARRIGLRVNFDETLDAKGAYTEGNDYVSINLANCESVDDAIETLLHEGVAHLGLRKLFGKEGFTEFINDVLNNSSRSIRDAIDNLVAENGWSREYAAEEYIAELAQRTDYNKMERSFWRKVVDAVRNLISMITGRPARITDGTIREMLLASYENLGVENNDIDFYNENWEGYTHFRERTKPAPEKTGIGYKAFYRKDGKLYPVMVALQNGEPFVEKAWLDAEEGEDAGTSKTGRRKVKAGGKGTHTGGGTLAYRPGFHLGDIPYALQFNVGPKVDNPLGLRNKEGEIIKVGKYFPKDIVWAEVEYAMDNDYQDEAMSYGYNENGKFNHALAGLPRIPEDGYYRYRTNANPATDPWIITGAMKINRVLSDEEVDDLVRAAGREPQLREGSADTVRNRIAYHGSAADFDRFDKAFYGTGEGSNAYGVGVYVTDVEGTGKMYAALSALNNFDDGRDVRTTISWLENSNKRKAQELGWAQERLDTNKWYSGETLTEEERKGQEERVALLQQEIERNNAELKELYAKRNEYQERAHRIINFNDELEDIENSPRHLYTVDIPEDNGDNYLSWDDNLTDSQIERIIQTVRKRRGDKWDEAREMLEERLSDKSKSRDGGSIAVLLGYMLEGKGTGSEMASNVLRRSGFVGMKVATGHSTGGDGRGTNYVIYRPKDVKILSNERFRTAGVEMFISNAENAVNSISMEKATPQQWLKMIESKGGLKAGEDKWIGLSDWLKASQKKTLTKQEVQDYINQNKIQIEEVRYIDAEDIAADGFEWNKAIAKRFGEEVFDAYHFEWDDDREIEIWIEDEDKAAELYNKFHKELGIEHELITKPTDDYYIGVDMRWLNELGLRIAQYGDEQMEKQFGKTINPTRIDYTTANLDNKREIALTVPTIESWHKEDKIHFGDAGEGRAIAWIRFGDTVVHTKKEEDAEAEYYKADNAYQMYRDSIVDKYNPERRKAIDAYGDYMKRMADGHTPSREEEKELRAIMADWNKYIALPKEGDAEAVASPEELAKMENLKLERDRLLSEWRNGFYARKRVLVIDEIQSKRHQEGREKGYSRKQTADEVIEEANTESRYRSLVQPMIDKYGVGIVNPQNFRSWREVTDEDRAIMEEAETLRQRVQQLQEIETKGVKEAPFEKNWHELAMKRMLRYAAENRYDAVAWTTGDQQAERYTLSNTVKSISSKQGPIDKRVDIALSNRNYIISLQVDEDGNVISSNEAEFEDKMLSDIVGKDHAQKLLSEDTTIAGDGLRIGGEGMKGFYDEILPRFMNKYGKKWGVSVKDMELPIGEDGKEVMHAVEVTPEMRESVMQGQLMFRQGGNYSPSPVSYSESMGAKRLAANETASKFGIDIEFRPSSEMRFNGMPLAGRWINGKMYICLEHCRDNNDVVRTVLHEGVGHNGLRRLIGDENMRDFCLDLFTSLPKAVRNKIATDAVNKYGGNIVSSVENFTANDVIREIGKDAMFESTEEWLAETSETIDYDNYRRNVWDIIRDALRRVLAKVGINVPLSTRDVKWLMVQSAFANHENDALVEARRQVVAKGLGMTLRQQAEVGEARQNARNRLATEVLAPAARIYNKDVMNWMSRLHETWVDKDDSVHRLVNAIEKSTGKKASAFEDIRLALNQQSSKGLAAIEKFEREHYQPMMDAIKALMEEKGCDLKEIERYVMIKHALERNEVFAKRDAREYYEAIHDANVRKIQDSDLEKDEKDRLVTKEDAKLNKHYTAIENGTDVKYAELREQDYGGLTSLFSEYDDIEPFRQGIESNEEYQARVLQARHPKYQYIDENGRPVVDMEQTEKAAQEEVDNFENGHAKAVDKLWKEINGATKATLLHQYQANMLSREQYTKVRDMFKYYVPLRGFADNTAEDMYDYYRSDQRNDFTPPLLKAKGRKTEPESPFGYIGSMASSGIAADMKNETKLALYYFVSNRANNDLVNISEVWYEKIGEDNDGKSIFSPVYPPFKEDLSSDEAKKEYEEWEKAMIEKAQDGLAFKGRRKLDLHNSVINIDNRQKNSHIIKFKVGGKDMMMYINGNPRAAQAINNELNVEMSTDYQKVFGKVLRWFSGINTSYNPEFWLSNAQRDALFALMSVNVKEDTEYNRAFRKNFGSLLRRTLTPGAKGGAYSLKKKLDEGKLGDERLDKLYAEFVENGGVTGYTTLKNNEEWELELRKYTGDEKEAVKAVKTLFQKVQNFGEAIEQMTRFAAYMTSREQGKEVKDAVNDAKELTVNFNRKGSGKAISFKEADRLRTKKGEKLTGLQKAFVVGASWIPVYGRRFIMFFNASTQGLNAMYKLFSKNPSKMAIWTAGYFALGVVQAALHAMLDDDDDYLDIPDYERRNNLLLGGNGVYLKWALPQEARVFYALGDMIVNHAMGREPHRNMVGELLAAAADIAPLNPTGGIAALAPSALTPVVEVALNRDYKGAKIFNDLKYLSDEERKQTPAYQKAFRGTGKPYIMISKFANWLSGGDYADAGWLNINPAAVEHIVQGATGGAGTTVGKFYRGTIGQIFGEDFMVRNTPFLSRILTVTDDRYRNAHTTDLFDYYKAEAEHTKKRIKTYEKNGDYDKLDKIYESEDYEIMLIYDSYKSILNWYNDELRYTEDNDERKELMREQDSIRKEMIQEISNIGNYD